MTKKYSFDFFSEKFLSFLKEKDYQAMSFKDNVIRIIDSMLQDIRLKH